jgi:hypothetical protein
LFCRCQGGTQRNMSQRLKTAPAKSRRTDRHFYFRKEIEMARPKGHPKSGGRKRGSRNKATLIREQESGLMSPPGLGCAKTPAVAPHVEISLSNCICGSQIILHKRRSMPCRRIVFSTFRGCMSFYTGSVIHDRGGQATPHSCPLRPESDRRPSRCEPRFVAN